jgi:anti-sigma-K factor RskA
MSVRAWLRICLPLAAWCATLAPAAALACLDAQTVRIDFLHSRLREAPKSRWGRKAYWAAAVAGASSCW